MAGKGRGWHGDPSGHARAGRLGGLKSRRRRSETSDNFAERIGNSATKTASEPKGASQKNQTSGR
jgi:hypothetical protein